MGKQWKQWQTLFSWASESLQMVTAAEIKRCWLDKPRQCFKRQRYHFAEKGLHGQNYDFSSSHVRMWELDHKEGWAAKTWSAQIVMREKTLESPLDSKEIKFSILKGISPEHSLEGLMLKLRFQSFGQLVERLDSLGKDPDAGKDWGQEEKGATEDEMVGWHHWLNGQEFEQTPGNSEGQGSPACCSPWVAKGQTWLSDWTTTKRTQKQGHTHIHWLNVHSHRLTLTETQSYRWCAYTQPIHRHVDTLKQKSDYIVTLTQTYSHSPSTQTFTHTHKD